MQTLRNPIRFTLFDSDDVRSGEQGWEILTYYNVYRIGVALLLVAMASPQFDLFTTGFKKGYLLFVVLGFIAVSICSFLGIKRRSPALRVHSHTLFMLDTALISVLALNNEIHEINIIVFYITTVAATAVMFRLKTALGYASIVTLVIYFRDILQFLEADTAIDGWYYTALTATGLFFIVIVVNRIAKRTQAVQSVLKQREMELADLDDINQLVVGQLEIGVLFIDGNLSIKLINDSARELIGDFIDGDGIAGKLAELLKIYVDMPAGKHFTFRHKNRIMGLNSTSIRSGIMVQIEDITTLSREIQQSKLSSIGRFASAVSHEIRNPLNAIGHAAQLIQPDPGNRENAELIGIIRKHVKRIDEIIESVLNRSRPGQVQQKQLELTPWLGKFIETFKQSIGGEAVSLEQRGDPVTIDFDPTQLEEILTNICQNSLKHGKTGGGRRVEIAFITAINENHYPHLDIVDNGVPIDDGLIDNLFEPFFSTDTRSPGLGLYISREFCRLNGAGIEYFKDVGQHGFRIQFQQNSG